MNKVLVVVDAQEDFVRGVLGTKEAQEALPVVQQVVDYAAKYFTKPVYYTKDTHGSSYLETQEGKNLPVKHCIEGTPGWKICREVLTDTCQIVKKRTFGHIGWTNDRFGNDTNEIWICGFCTDICVMANFQILKALYPEVPIVVIEDACAGVTPELHEAALKVMKSCQARVVKWEELKNDA